MSQALVRFQWTNLRVTFEPKPTGGKQMAVNSLAGRNLGMLLLGVWLIVTGLLPLLNVRVSTTVTTVLAILAIAAGILILLKR